jgi:hypothetical protein
MSTVAYLNVTLHLPQELWTNERSWIRDDQTMLYCQGWVMLEPEGGHNPAPTPEGWLTEREKIPLSPLPHESLAEGGYIPRGGS